MEKKSKGLKLVSLSTLGVAVALIALSFSGGQVTGQAIGSGGSGGSGCGGDVYYDEDRGELVDSAGNIVDEMVRPPKTRAPRPLLPRRYPPSM